MLRWEETKLSEVKTATEKQSFLDEVASMPGGANIRACIQCGICSGSCPSAEVMEFVPRKVIAMVRAGMREEVLRTSSMWRCLSCYLCTARCPRDVKPTDILHAIETIAIREGKASKETSTPIMYQAFANSIKSKGRVHEFGFTVNYYLRTMPELLSHPINTAKKLPLALNLIRHGRMPLSAKRTKGADQLKIILDKAKTAKAGGGAR
jgi:heterodisulfide reductase subunit C